MQQQNQETLYDVRTKICNTCSSYNKIMDTCQQTEKIISIYNKRITNQCPLNRWPQ
jgi:hypothetical protein